MTRPYARTNTEAHLYMELRPCRCGSPEFERQSTVIDDAGILCSRYSGTCRSCGAAREFVFELPPTIRPIRTEIEFGGDDPSRLLDPGEWLAVADDHARRQPGTRRDLDIARAAVEEVLKFVPAGAERVPDDAFRTERGRAVRDAEPGRFRRTRLEAVLGAYRDLLAKWSQPARSAPPAPSRAAPALPASASPVATHPLPLDEHPLPALVEALAIAAARQQGFEGLELRRQASDLAGQIQTVLRLFQINAAEQRQRTKTMTELDRLLDAIAGTDSPTGRAVAAHRSEIADAFREVDLVQISSGLTALAEWLRNPTEDTGQPVQQLLARLQAALAAHAEDASKPS